MIDIVVKPFINAHYHYWVDAAMMILTYKTILFNKDLASINHEAYSKALTTHPHAEVERWTLIGSVDGLISGAKFTHVGGSLYGEVLIHYVLPKLLGYKPVKGIQAGDDTLMGIPIGYIKHESAVDTYAPVAEKAALLGLELNKSKQMWHVMNGELAKVFLQEVFHVATKTYGIGSAYRPLSAIFTTEYTKHLSIAGQMMQEISRMNQGADSPFITPAVKFWFSNEQWLGKLFKDEGIRAWYTLISGIEKSDEDLSKSINADEFNWSLKGVDFRNPDNVPIVKVMVDVSQKMEFTSVNKPAFAATPETGLENEVDTSETLESEEV